VSGFRAELHFADWVTVKMCHCLTHALQHGPPYSITLSACRRIGGGMVRPRAVALQIPKGLASEGGWRRGRTPFPLVNLSEWLKLRHALTPSRHRGPAPTALTGRTALQDGWHGDEPAAIRRPQVERRA
jgi:hypothetical protein